MKGSSSHNSNTVRFRSATAQGACMLLCTVLFGEVHAQEPAATPDQIKFFETKIRPVPVERCYGCHAAGAKIWQGGLRVDHRAGLLRGGDSGLLRGMNADNPQHANATNQFHATMMHLLGINHTQRTWNHLGREFRLTDVHGSVVKEILA